MSPDDPTPHPTLGRRAFLGVAAGALPAAAVTARAAQPTEAAARGGTPGPGGMPGLIVRERDPLNLEFPFPTLDAAVIPADRFFVRSHFRIPAIDAAAWRLRVDGDVGRPLDLSLGDLKAMPSKTLAATAECAGNGRAFLVPKAKGLPWELGAVGNAEWTGVPLAAVLDAAGAKPSAVEAILTGADEGEVAEEPKSPGPIRFERSLPLAKAKSPEVLLAWAMNGEPLAPEHGFPVRAVVPCWYGMAWVKWLTRVTLTAEPFRGFWQTAEYAYWKRVDGRPTAVPVAEMRVKSQIARPCLHEEVAAGSTYRVTGAAWAGDATVAKVEVSADGGRGWAGATPLGEAVPFAWRLWEFEWRVPDEPGRYTLLSRATDGRGVTQPDGHDRDRKGYMISRTLPAEVVVR